MFIYQTEKRGKYYDQVIEIYRKTGYTAYRISKLNKVPVGASTIMRWIANFVAENGENTPQEDMRKERTGKAEEIKALEAKVAELEEQLRVEKMRNRLNDKIIDIAEQRYSIQIRKKAGAKQ